MDLPPRRPERPPLASINVTPLVDVMLVLLIVFLVTASLGQEGITVTLPRAEGAAIVPKGSLTVTIAADRSLFLGNERVPEAEFAPVLQAALQSRASKTVLLKADERVAYGDFVRVVSLIQAAGADQVGMITNPPQK